MHFRRTTTAAAAAMLGLGGLAGTAHADSTQPSSPTATKTAASAPSASAATVRHTGEARIQGGGWHVKNAMRVGGAGPKPSDKVVCVSVNSGGGAKKHGEVCFDPAGDYFWVKDTASDGMSIYMRALYRGNTQTVFECRNDLGKAAGWTACYFDSEMKEGRGINFIAMAWKGNTPVYKSVTADAEN
ncbi:hypothetical protein [Streptomyces sp. NPDC058989]|uniref:hypothetical protein n=1 Tax=Streptomyces sp. NPDC058989 TaxID=3346686 RepID=UPI0036C07EF8